MTVEVAVLNQLAVAMAADSAQTVGPAWKQKIFTSADKIFALSRKTPIGVMIYGSADLLGLPWETIVKAYREEAGDMVLPTVDDHAKAFLDFLRGDHLFSIELQDKRYISLVTGYFQMLRQQIRKRAKTTIAEEKPITNKEVALIVRSVIAEHHELWNQQEMLEAIPDESADAIRKKHRKSILQAIRQVFEKLPLSQNTRSKLVDLATCLVTRRAPRRIGSPTSGLVIAGFGRNEWFPVLRAFEVLTVVDGVLVYQRNKNKCLDINHETRGAVVAFAQEDIVSTFMEGVAPNYQAAINVLIHELVKKLTSSSSQEDSADLGKPVSNSINSYLKSLGDYRRQKHVNPILEVVSVLPKDELASMAEALANLTSLKRRLTMGERETVGGPIDVAVISKGDGLVWIKRKNYFQKDLNPQFFSRYYKEEQSAQEAEKL